MPRPPAKRQRERQRNAPAKTIERAAKNRNATRTRDNDDQSTGNTLDQQNNPQSSGNDVYMSGAVSGAGMHSNEQLQEDENVAVSGTSVAIQTTPTSKLISDKRVSPRQPDTTRSKGYSSNLSILGKRGDTSSKIQKTGTPAFESSMLSNFRRRPRQPSILQMMQAELSSEGDSEDFLGSFDPEDESTPFKVAKRTRISQDLPASPSSVRQSLAAERLEDQNSPTPEVDPQFEASALDGSEHQSEGGSTTLNANNDQEQDVSEENSLPPHARSERSEPPEILSQTMMPPISSSVAPSPARPHEASTHKDNSTSNQGPTRHTRRGSKQGKSQTAGPGPEHISTAALTQNLLPRRKTRRQLRNWAEEDEFDLDEDDGDQGDPERVDEDELSFLPRRSGRTRKTRALREVNDRANKKMNSVNNHTVKGTAAAARKKDTAAKVHKANATNSYRTARQQYSTEDNGNTYSSSSRLRGRNVAGVDEHQNEEREVHDSSSSESTPVRNSGFISEELMLQAKRFAEIGEWELEFEDVTVSASQSSPAR